jgi:hypothetical protein
MNETAAPRLDVGVQVCCPLCEKFHVSKGSHGASLTDYAANMMFVDCDDLTFYVGQRGEVSRHEVRVEQKK